MNPFKSPEEEIALATLLTGMLVPSLIAIVWFGFCVNREHHGLNKLVKWLAMVVLLVGIWVNITPFVAIDDLLYKSIVFEGRWSLLAHKAGLVVTGLTAIGLAVWGWLNDRRHVSDF